MHLGRIILVYRCQVYAAHENSTLPSTLRSLFRKNHFFCFSSVRQELDQRSITECKVSRDSYGLNDMDACAVLEGTCKIDYTRLNLRAMF